MALLVVAGAEAMLMLVRSEVMMCQKACSRITYPTDDSVLAVYGALDALDLEILHG